MLLNNESSKEVWERVSSELHFVPDSSVNEHSFDDLVPFKIDGNFAVYGIEEMTDNQADIMDDIIKNIFAEISKTGERMYALDWRHSSFLYDPKNEDDQKAF